MSKEKIIELLTIYEFADLLKVHHNTVRNAIKYGRIHAFRIGRGKRSEFRIFATELMRMAAFDASEMIDNIVEERIKPMKTLRRI